jgi:DNA-binding response OmpR family regulator
MPTEGDASIEILDVQGRLIRSVHRGFLPAGEHRLDWDGRDEAGNRVAPGLYMARLHSNDEQRLLKLVRSHSSWSTVPFIVLSASQEAGVEDALAHGADGYLAKPFTPQRLMDTIERLVAFGRAASQPGRA